jgi:nucleotide-binding universal stress UspA family protein
VKKILVAMDGSDPALKAMGTAADLARGLNAKLTLAYARYFPMVYPVEFAGPEIDALEEEERERGRQMLADATRRAGELGVTSDSTLLIGPPAEAIADYANSQDYDLVVVGSRGRGAVTRVLVGSVADRLVHICKRPVLVVR